MKQQQKIPTSEPRQLGQATWLGVATITCMVFTLLFLRLGDIQLVKGATFQQQADDNRFFHQLRPAQRGLLLDRYGDPLVWNVEQHFQVSDKEVLFPILTPISREDALQTIATQGAEAVVTKPQRLYRYPASLAHVVGYVGEVTAEDLQKNSLFKPGMVVGKAGLELQYQDVLRGQEGEVVYEVDALGRKQRVVQTKPPLPGKDIGTTLDPYLTEYVNRQMGDIRGTVIITDAKTGKILSMTSKPSFDPNIFSQVTEDPLKEAERKQRVQETFLDPRNLFFNRALSGAYPPGSIFKLMTALAGLENQKINTTTTVIDEGTLKVGEYQYGNWYYRQYGRTEGEIGLTRAIARSNDIFFYKVAEWVGPTALAEFSRLFGYGERTGVELPAEARGIVPDPDWKQRVKSESWYLGNTYHFGIGQGDVLTTPLQIAQMTQAIANDGMLCPVSILAGGHEVGTQVARNTPECHQVGVTSEHLHTVLEGMVQACSANGTAFPFFPYNATKLEPGKTIEYSLANGAVACKTGTAEFGGADAQGHRRTHAWFTSFLTLKQATESAQLLTATDSATVQTITSPLQPVGELSDEQLHQFWKSKAGQLGFPDMLTISVLVESDDTVPFREGSADAAPIAKKIVDWLVSP